MAWYLAKLVLLLPLLALLIWGSLKLSRTMQQRLGAGGGTGRRIRLVESAFLGPGLRIAVVEFRGREIVLGCGRNGLTLLDVIAQPDADRSAACKGDA